MDYYSILGVERGAGPEDIKKAYRKMAMQHHPDRGGDLKKFQEIQNAYDTLSDPGKREQYDNPRSQGPHNFEFHFGPGGMDGMGGFEDMIDIFFRQHGQGFQRRQARNRDLRIVIDLPLVETLENQKKTVMVKNLAGEQVPMEINIPRGISHGATIKYSGQGDNSQKSLPPGDLYVVINIQVPSGWRVAEPHLVVQKEITCFEAILGCKKPLDTIEGKTLEMQIPPGVQPGTKLAIRGHGLYSNNQRGDIIVDLQIKIPTDLSEQQKTLLTQHFA